MLRSVHRRFGTAPWIATICAVFGAFMMISTGAFVGEAAAAGTQFSGKELYLGLVLADGPVADLIPEIRDNYRVSNFASDEDLDLIHAVQGRIMSAVDNLDPTFFDTFAAQVESGDHVMIHNALQWATETTVAAIGKIPEVQTLRQQMEDDPAVRSQLLTEIRGAEGMDEIPDEDLEFAVDLVLADSLRGQTEVAPALISIVAVIVAVAAIVAAITIVAAQSYALVLNIAAAVNVAAAIVAWVTVYTPEATTVAGSTLLHEEMVDSVATLLAV